MVQDKTICARKDTTRTDYFQREMIPALLVPILKMILKIMNRKLTILNYLAVGPQIVFRKYSEECLF